MHRRPRVPTQQRLALDLRAVAIAVVMSATWSGSAHALALEECKPLEDDAKRLACYDSVSGRAITAADKQMPSVVKDVKNDVSGIGLVANQERDTTAFGTRAS